MGFSGAPAYLSSVARGSRSDHLLEPVLEAIRKQGGVVRGDSQAQILAQIRPLVPRASGRAISSALWKLVRKKQLIFAKAEVSHRDAMPAARVYRLV